MATQNVERKLQVEKLKIEIYPNRIAAGEAAARAAAASLRELARTGDFAVIFATGASQLATLEALTSTPNLPWHRVTGFHMDEYIGIPPDHPASFRRYLKENLTDRAPLREFYGIDGESDPETVCRDYAARLRSYAPKLCLLGIGENGHLAFNDPGEANFEDPLDMRVVRLDEVCRNQQLAEGWFPTFDDVPDRAMTLTIPTLFRVPKLIASVPSGRKARIVRRTLVEPISTAVPATILRTHPDTTVYLDEESAEEIKRWTPAAPA